MSTAASRRITPSPSKFPLATSSWDDREIDAAVRILRSGQTTMGATVQAFEAEFARYIGTKYAVMVNSGSSANLLMVAAYTLRYGKGTVIVPAVSWSTSYSPFQQYGWRLVFVDVDDTLCMNPEAVRQANAVLTTRPGVILAVNLLGNSCQFGALHQQPMLEDNCEALGAEYAGSRTGSFGRMASHSFFFSHHLNTMEGGMITTNDRTFYDMLRSLRAHGWTRDLNSDNALGLLPEPFGFAFPGYNVRPLELQAAIGLVQLEKLPEMLRIRRENACACPLPLPREVGTSSWFGFATPRTPQLEAACETRPVVAGNFTRSPAMKWYQDAIVHGSLPMANRVHDDYVYIGNHATPIDWERVLG